MKFFSTRDPQKKLYSSAEVIKQGLADDGGLFVPESIPSVGPEELEELSRLTYPQLAATILGKFLTDYTYEELLEDASNAYSSASFPEGAAPLKKIGKNMYSLELWKGPTAAFKDMALQIMPRLLSRALKKTGETKTALILVATSGDTGKAALEGHKDVDMVKVMVFYPAEGVSKIQKLQMVTQTGTNVNVCAINGNFDDAQTGVKKIFSDPAAKERLAEKSYILSSANSINWGRLAPQIVYYFHTYCELLRNKSITMGDRINVCVPTGNFGNIFAAYLAKQMGLPINKMVCASNSNNILTDFINTGVYDRNREFHLTMSPSMDILISSNLERLLYFVAGCDRTTEYMSMLAKCGRYEVESEIRLEITKNFVAYFANEDQTAQALKKFYTERNYLADTHTSVALHSAEKYIEETGDTTPMVVVSTASPYKFAADVYKSITGKAAKDGTAALDELSELTLTDISYPLKDLDAKEVRFSAVVSKEDMLEEVYKFM